MAAWDGKKANGKNKNQNTNHKKQKTVHIYPTPLLSAVAMRKVATKIVKPTAKTLNRKFSFEINWPPTNAARNNFPTSYNDLANSLRCELSKLITNQV